MSQRFRPSPAPVRRAGGPLRDPFQARAAEIRDDEPVRAPPFIGERGGVAKRIIAITPQCFSSSLLKLVTPEHLAKYEKKCRERARMHEPSESTLFFLDTLGGPEAGGAKSMTRDACEAMKTWFAVADRIDLYTDLGVTPFMKHLADNLPREKVEFELLGDEWATFLQSKPEAAPVPQQTDPEPRTQARKASRRLRSAPAPRSIAELQPDSDPIDEPPAQEHLGRSLAQSVLWNDSSDPTE